MADRIRALVALDSGVDSNYIQSLLPNDTAFEVVGLINGLDESWRTLQETAPDLLIVVCSGYSDRRSESFERVSDDLRRVLARQRNVRIRSSDRVRPLLRNGLYR